MDATPPPEAPEQDHTSLRWWYALDAEERKFWLGRAKSDKPEDAWTAFMAYKPGQL
jgi:hypothetical protein